MMHLPALAAFSRSTSRPWALGLALASLLASCATLPREPTERALYIDAQKALNGESRLGWTVDRVEIEQASVQAERSACHVEPARRAALRRWVTARITAEGGPAKLQFRSGVDLDDLDDVIDLERTRALLDEVERHMPEDCPFWIAPSATFRGLHSVADRFVLLGESAGGASLSIGDGQALVGGGGAARLFASYGISTAWQLAAGIEAGGDAVLQKAEDGVLAPEGAFRFGVPAFLRWIQLDRIYDVELAAVTRLTDGRLVPWGGRIALAGGVTGLRRLGFMPALQLFVGYELYPAQRDTPAQHVLRIGTRVGIDWDP